MLKKLLAPFLLLCLSAPAYAIDIGAMPACAGYDSDVGGCPVYNEGVCTVMAADGVIANNAGILSAIYISAAEVNDDFIIYDNASAASGTKIFEQTNVAAGDKQFSNVPARFANGAYLDVTAADASAAFTLTICFQQ